MNRVITFLLVGSIRQTICLETYGESNKKKCMINAGFEKFCFKSLHLNRLSG